MCFPWVDGMLQVPMKLALIPLAATAAYMSVPPTDPQAIDEVGALTAGCEQAVEGAPSAKVALSRARTLGSLKYPVEELENYMFLCAVYIRSRTDAGYFPEPARKTT